MGELQVNVQCIPCIQEVFHHGSDVISPLICEESYSSRSGCRIFCRIQFSAINTDAIQIRH